MNNFGLPEFLFLATAVVLVVLGRNIPEFLQSLVLSKKQFNERRSQVVRPMEVIDYNSEITFKR